MPIQNPLAAQIRNEMVYGLNLLINEDLVIDANNVVIVEAGGRIDICYAEFFDEYHHYSHVTTIKKTCRVPAFGPLSVGHFLRFVLSYFYQSHFSNDESFDELQARSYSRTLSMPPGHELFFETSIKP